MEEHKPYRHELKYSISYPDYLTIRGRIKNLMRPDPHAGPDGKYRIRSIYFDNIDDKALREKVYGVSKREKFRIRYYNDDFSFITLEKKMKIGCLCLKYDATITEEECRKILAGGQSNMFFTRRIAAAAELYKAHKAALWQAVLWLVLWVR